MKSSVCAVRAARSCSSEICICANSIAGVTSTMGKLVLNNRYVRKVF